MLVDPLDAGESFGSWLDRIARLNGCPPGVMVELLGLPVRPAAFRDRVGYGVVIDDATCEAVEAASGLTKAEIRMAHLVAYDGTALHLGGLGFEDVAAFETAARREWADFYGTRACPRCLAESGGVWRLWWKLSWAAACPIHGCLLIDACPDCGARLRRGHRGHPAELSLVRDRDPVCCDTTWGRRSVCRARIDEAPAIPVEPGFARAQAQLVMEAEGIASMEGSSRTGGASWFASLKAVVVLIRLAVPAWSPPLPEWAAEAVLADADQVRDGTRAVAADGPPRTPATTAGLLMAASALLEAMDRDGHAEVLTPLVDAASIWRRRTPRDPFAIAELPPTLERYLSGHTSLLLRISR